MSEHTKEGWAARGSAVYFPRVLGGFDLSGCPNPEANARRIAACVNACQGLSTEDLEQTGLVSAVGYQMISMKALNAELLEALEWMVEKSDAGEFHDGACMKKARAAIAKARSQA